MATVRKAGGAATAWKLLPDRPTAGMLAAGHDALRDDRNCPLATLYRKIWQAAPDDLEEARATTLVRGWKRMPYHATQTMHNAVRELLGQEPAGGSVPLEVIYLTFWDVARGAIQAAPDVVPTNAQDAAAGNVNAIRHIACAEGYRAGKDAALSAYKGGAAPQLVADSTVDGTALSNAPAETYADLFNALHRIDTAAVFLPGFEVRHDGGIEAFTQNIVDAIANACETHAAAVATGVLDVKTLHGLVSSLASSLELVDPGNSDAGNARTYLERMPPIT